MKDEANPLTVDQDFFAALLASNIEKLERILTDDFILIDVMSGSEITKTAMLQVMKSGQLKFDAIERGEPRMRSYGTTAVITGRTQMKMHFGEAAFTTRSRYTHVFVEQAGGWRMATAQGTQITGE
jgi:ketosteroid isomerase-like protein